MSIYIQSAKQLSAQKPLLDEWFDNPVYYEQARVQTIDPDFTYYFSSLPERRRCLLLKRAVLLSRLTLKEASVEIPDAIISGTGLGCLYNTEKFLNSITDNDEKFLQPTYFIQSTHNILSSTIAIDLKCHGYNSTYVNRGVSFENSLLDAIMQFEQERIQTALVGGFDELTDEYYQIFKRIGIWNFATDTSPKKKCFTGEAAVSMLIGKTKNEHTICEINDVKLLYKPTHEQIKEALDAILAKAGCALSDIDAVLTGLNTYKENDKIYRDRIDYFFKNIPILQYKHLFGESFSSSAISVYVASTCLRKGYAPAVLSADKETGVNHIKRILVYNHYRNKSHSFVLLSACL